MGARRFAYASPPVASVDPLVVRGAEIFFNETFNGNGRTCGTCHPAENNFTIDPTFIATLPPDDPLFVAEFIPALSQHFEKPELMRKAGLILGARAREIRPRGARSRHREGDPPARRRRAERRGPGAREAGGPEGYGRGVMGVTGLSGPAGHFHPGAAGGRPHARSGPSPRGTQGGGRPRRASGLRAWHTLIDTVGGPGSRGC